MKKISTLLTSLGLLAYSALPAFAQTVVDPCPQGQFGPLCSKFNAGDTGHIISTVITFMLIAAVIIALFYLIYGGIRWITSGGDKGKVEEARKHIIAAIIGLVVAFVAYFILQIVLSIFGLGSISRLQLPTF
jgi:hypothetical protein